MTNLVKGKQLGQLRPANTTAASIYSPGANVVAELAGIWICEVLAGTPTYQLFHDDNGTTYDEGTALAFNPALTASQSFYIPFEPPLWMADSAGNFAVRTSVNSSINFTLYGIEHED